jgi:ATP-dependent DNA helicase RecG
LIVNLARSNEYIARADVINLLRVKDSKAYGLLKELVNQGILEAVNKGRYAKYKLK